MCIAAVYTLREGGKSNNLSPWNAKKTSSFSPLVKAEHAMMTHWKCDTNGSPSTPKISVNILVNAFLSPTLDRPRDISVTASGTASPLFHSVRAGGRLPLTNAVTLLLHEHFGCSSPCPNGSWLATPCPQLFPSPSGKCSSGAFNMYLYMWSCMCWDDSIYVCWETPNFTKAQSN